MRWASCRSCMSCWYCCRFSSRVSWPLWCTCDTTWSCTRFSSSRFCVWARMSLSMRGKSQMDECAPGSRGPCRSTCCPSSFVRSRWRRRFSCTALRSSSSSSLRSSCSWPSTRARSASRCFASDSCFICTWASSMERRRAGGMSGSSALSGRLYSRYPNFSGMGNWSRFWPCASCRRLKASTSARARRRAATACCSSSAARAFLSRLWRSSMASSSSSTLRIPSRSCIWRS
mmetsp:Transcript_1937/g.3968  ORF Transcript_1937/g.3968 Transcript_1937/m.3968 type:complete len:231 (+) Transcript_1937:250-942(+)